MPSSHSPDRLAVAFDDDHAVANAGLMLPATLAERLGIGRAVRRLVDLGDAPGAANAGGKAMTLVHSMLAGGDWIDDADVLRAGATAQVLGHRVLAPSTLGTFLRSFTFGHIRQLDQVAETVLARAWAAGAGPGPADDHRPGLHHLRGPRPPQGRRRLRLHPPAWLPPAAGQPGRHRRGAALPAMRTGWPTPPAAPSGSSTSWPAGSAAPAPPGQLTLRADSGFWSAKVIRRLPPAPDPLLDHRPPDQAGAGRDRRHPRGGLDRHRLPRRRVAHVAETSSLGRADRLIVRRTRHPAPSPRCSATGATTPLSPTATAPRGAGRRPPPPRRGRACHPRPQGRRRAPPLPSGRFPANAAWLALIATLAHNLLRWVAAIGLGNTEPVGQDPAPPLARPARPADPLRPTALLHLPTDWPWAPQFLHALAHLPALPAPGCANPDLSWSPAATPYSATPAPAAGQPDA